MIQNKKKITKNEKPLRRVKKNRWAELFGGNFMKFLYHFLGVCCWPWLAMRSFAGHVRHQGRTSIYDQLRNTRLDFYNFVFKYLTDFQCMSELNVCTAVDCSLHYFVTSFCVTSRVIWCAVQWYKSTCFIPTRVVIVWTYQWWNCEGSVWLSLGCYIVTRTLDDHDSSFYITMI